VSGCRGRETTLATATDNYRRDNADVGFGGYCGTELNNITFHGERQAAERTIAAPQTYQQDDQHLRALNTSGNLASAIQFDISTARATPTTRSTPTTARWSS
jgi:hypothetical protein